MGRNAGGLPSGWDTPIPEAIWPEAMLSAIRHDLAALASPRVIATIQQWRLEAADDHAPDKQREANRLLQSLGRALLPNAEQDAFDTDGVTTAVPESAEPVAVRPSDDHTVDSFQLPPKPRGLRRPPSTFDTPESTMLADDAIVDEVDSDTDARVKKHEEPLARALTTGASAPPLTGFAEEDEKPTTAFLRPDTSSRDAAPPPPPPPPLPVEALAKPRARMGSSSQTILPDMGDDKPTRHIDLPEARRRLDSLGPPERTEMADAPPPPPSAAAEPTENEDDDLESTHALIAEEAPSHSDLLEFGSYAGPAGDDEGAASDRGPSRLAPKPGIIRRRSPRPQRNVSSVRPRAAMHHVRTLYGVLMPFASELIPLPFERRSRRFWARWREVAGDRGVRREFIEDLLRSANDRRTLVCELIAEVQSVDVKSVYALVDKMETTGELSSAPSKPSSPDRTRGPLVGASVRVEGVLQDEDG